MIKITLDKAQALHSLLIAETGGTDGLRDRGLLESALEAAFATFAGIELFPSIEEKAARLGMSLISNHAFADGNKRVGMLIMLVFLKVNGVEMNLSDEDVVRAGLGAAAGEMDFYGMLEWIWEHRI